MYQLIHSIGCIALAAGALFMGYIGWSIATEEFRHKRGFTPTDQQWNAYLVNKRNGSMMVVGAMITLAILLI